MKATVYLSRKLLNQLKVKYAASMKDYSSVSLGAKGRNQFVTNDELVGKIIDMLR